MLSELWLLVPLSFRKMYPMETLETDGLYQTEAFEDDNSTSTESGLDASLCKEGALSAMRTWYELPLVMEA